MPLDEADLKLMWDMLDSARRVVSYVHGVNEAQFHRDTKTQDAVARCVEIIGEAARKVSDSGRSQVPEVPWEIIVGTRHILAHDYREVDQPKVWRIAPSTRPSCWSIFNVF